MNFYFELGGISIPIKAGLAFIQSYENIGGAVVQRMQSDRAIKQRGKSCVAAQADLFPYFALGIKKSFLLVHNS
ncbi:MAG: hypothetical protein BGO43_15240 [Gammaproteobacteria bacterium 39-13]|nr:hypothetical protein [Gammaproteobacteria bacterium]OJV87772.1 MAG: hypothetical protein BGO43_15240 [Gammaproteobacteria bacterium 39-13]